MSVSETVAQRGALARRARNRTPHILDRIGNGGVAAMAGLVIATLAAVYLFVGSQSYQTFSLSHVPLNTLLFSKDWNNSFGSAVLIVGSLSLVALGLLLAVPLSIAIAFFITEVAPPWLARPLRSIVELFLGIPSIIFGLLGLIIVVPVVRETLDYIVGNHYYTSGKGYIAAAIVVAFMVLPTITTIAVDSLAAIPRDLREGSLALGATRWQTMTRTLFPAALPGIMTGVILGAARILGETVAVALVIGDTPSLFGVDHQAGPFPIRIGSTSVITTQIFHNFGNTVPTDDLYHVLWTLAFVLLVISGLLILASRAVTARKVY